MFDRLQSLSRGKFHVSSRIEIRDARQKQREKKGKETVKRGDLSTYFHSSPPLPSLELTIYSAPLSLSTGLCEEKKGEREGEMFKIQSEDSLSEGEGFSFLEPKRKRRKHKQKARTETGNTTEKVL